MGTRGAIGFFVNGKTKVTYNHFDSYPSGVGLDVLEFAEGNTWSDLTDMAEGIEMLEQESNPSEELKEKAKQLGIYDDKVGLQTDGDLYCLLHGAQGNLDTYAKLGAMVDDESFLGDSLFCEWAYIINVDDGVLEVYIGGNKKPDQEGRYAHFEEVDPPGYREEIYYGVVLVKEYPLDDLPDEKQFLADLEDG